MKILYVAQKYDYGDPLRGFSFEHYNFYDSLKNMDGKKHEIIYFPFDEIAHQRGLECMNKLLLETAFQEKPDLCFFVIISHAIKKETIRDITGMGFITCNWFTDDQWRFGNFSRHWVDAFTFVVTTDAVALQKYRRLGIKNVIKSQWACSQFFYKPLDIKKIYDVTFVGQAHGNRRNIINKLSAAGIRVMCFGKGWQIARVGQEDMVKIFSQSKINLNFSNASGQVSLKHVAKIFLTKNADQSIVINHPRTWIDNGLSLI